MDPTNAFAVESFNGKTYYLHSRLQKLKGGAEVRLFFFAGTVREGALAEVPAGYTVSANANTGLPLLRKVRPAA